LTSELGHSSLLVVIELVKVVDDDLGDPVDDHANIGLGGIEGRGDDDVISAHAVGGATAWVKVDLVVRAQR
jgi:hypothetical protein